MLEGPKLHYVVFNKCYTTMYPVKNDSVLLNAALGSFSLSTKIIKVHKILKTRSRTPRSDNKLWTGKRKVKDKRQRIFYGVYEFVDFLTGIITCLICELSKVSRKLKFYLKYNLRYVVLSTYFPDRPSSIWKPNKLIEACSELINANQAA